MRLGKRKVRSPAAMMVLALIVGSGDFSSIVNRSWRYLSHRAELYSMGDKSPLDITRITTSFPLPPPPSSFPLSPSAHIPPFSQHTHTHTHAHTHTHTQRAHTHTHTHTHTPDEHEFGKCEVSWCLQGWAGVLGGVGYHSNNERFKASQHPCHSPNLRLTHLPHQLSFNIISSCPQEAHLILHPAWRVQVRLVPLGEEVGDPYRMSITEESSKIVSTFVIHFWMDLP